MRRLHSGNLKALLGIFRAIRQTYREHKPLPSFGPRSNLLSIATEGKYEVVVPVDAMVAIDTFVQLFRLKAFCVTDSVHHA
jgi:hypothetical protein